MALAATLAVAAPAYASVDTFGHVRGRDRKVLVRAFKAHHHGGYVVRGLHASVLYKLRYAGVYWLRSTGGRDVDRASWSSSAAESTDGARYRT